MEKVWIFGDSYADKTYTKGKDWAWPNLIEKKYQVTNFAKCGSGPDWSLNLLRKSIRENPNNTEDINLIFFVSDVNRFNFNFYSSVDDQSLFFEILDSKKHKRNPVVYKKVKKYLRYKPFCQNFLKFYLLTNEDFAETEMLKIVGSLTLYEKYFKKILVWPIFHFSDIKPDSSKKFQHVDYLLSDLDIALPRGFDHRPNHLSQKSHKKVFKQLSKWIDHGQEINTKVFQKNT